MARVRGQFIHLQRRFKRSDVLDNTLERGVEFGLKVASPVGNLIGQLLFGWLADVVGRKRMCKSGRSVVSSDTKVFRPTIADGVELMIIITSTFAQAIAGSGPAVDIVAVLTLLRFIMGIGIGGDYPLSAVITSEFAATRSRGRLMTAVFASQGWGYLGKGNLPSPTRITYRPQLRSSWHWSPSPHLKVLFCKTRRQASNTSTTAGGS